MPNTWWGDLSNTAYGDAVSRVVDMSQPYSSGGLTWNNSSGSSGSLTLESIQQAHLSASQQGMQQPQSSQSFQAEYERQYTNIFSNGLSTMKVEAAPKKERFKRNLPDWF